jgi:hypothetical protein
MSNLFWEDGGVMMEIIGNCECRISSAEWAGALLGRGYAGGGRMHELHQLRRRKVASGLESPGNPQAGKPALRASGAVRVCPAASALVRLWSPMSVYGRRCPRVSAGGLRYQEGSEDEDEDDSGWLKSPDKKG